MTCTKVFSCVIELKLVLPRPCAAEDRTQRSKQIKKPSSDSVMQFQRHITARRKIHLSKNENVAYAVDGKNSIFVVT